ncbi:MAG: hypothetical protein QOF76_5301 [Solirubrobacteraceae bacterium]|nr:hypothetical protein [Solirubrobacteraceae bacterium]
MCPDLLFGSRVEGALRAAGHEVTRDAAGADVLVVDLTADEFDAMRVERGDLPSVGFYPHVDVDTRTRALAAGYDVVVPRSKMARETVAVVEGALAA